MKEYLKCVQRSFASEDKTTISAFTLTLIDLNIMLKGGSNNREYIVCCIVFNIVFFFFLV